MDDNSGLIKPQNTDPHQPTVVSPTSEPSAGSTDNSFHPVVINPLVDNNGQPLVNSSLPNNQPPPVIVSGKKKKERYKLPKFRQLNLWSIFTAILFLAIIGGAASYLWFLPIHWSSAYTNKIQPDYIKQAGQMTVVYESFTRPIFSGSNASATSNSEDLTYTAGVLLTASAGTNSLRLANHLTILPGTTFLHKVATANQEYQAMQQYVSDSQTLIADYSMLVTYIQKFSVLAQTQLGTLQNDLNNLGLSSANPSTIEPALQTTTTDLQNITNQVKALKPSSDLEQFNNDLLGDLHGMDNSLQGLLSVLQGNTSVDLVSSSGELQTAVTNYITLLGTNPFVNLQTDSTLHSQIVSLEAETPL